VTELSLIVPTTRAWPDARACLDAVAPQARELGAQLLVFDGDPAGGALPPDAATRYPGVERVALPGASVYALRAASFGHARGDVFLFTEDHCVPGPGWAAGHLDAHRRDPGAAVVGGAVANGARAALSDWASFLSNHAPWVPPLAGGDAAAVDRASVSYKRDALPAMWSEADEVFLDERLRRAGARFVLDGAMVSVHDQSLGPRRTIAVHFHNARAVTGLRVRAGLRARDRAWRLAATPAAAVVWFVGPLATMLRRPRAYPPRAWASLLFLPAISVSLAAGCVAGLTRGPGASTVELR